MDFKHFTARLDSTRMEIETIIEEMEIANKTEIFELVAIIEDTLDFLKERGIDDAGQLNWARSAIQRYQPKG